MNERQVSIEGREIALATPFLVIATQNPIEYYGTYPLPEAQLDRFAVRLSLGYPDEASELQLLRDRKRTDPLDAVRPILTCEEIRRIQEEVRAIELENSLAEYMMTLIRATREAPEIRLGASPRALMETGFPFQIFKLSCASGSRQKIICHPEWIPLRSLRLPEGNAGSSESVSSAASVGGSMDFYGCREYRTGDDPRKIHWVASAKHAQFVVKEFQEEKLSRAALILDNSLAAERFSFRTLFRNLFQLKVGTGGYDDAPFEAAVSLCASLAASLSSGDFVVDLFAAGSEIHRFRTGGRYMTQEAFLDLLAALEPSGKRDRFGKITPEDIRTIASSGAVFLLLLRVDPESSKLYRALVETGVPVRAFLIGASSGPGWVEPLRTGDILGGREMDL